MLSLWRSNVYGSACSTVVGTSEFVFGDLSKLTKDITDANKLTKKMRPTQSSGRRDTYRHGPTRSQGSFSSRGSNRFHAYQGSKSSNFLGKARTPSSRKRKKGARQTNAMISEVCDKLILARNDVVQNMLGQQTSFCAGRLRNYLAQWKGLTSDPIILQDVAGIKIEFKGDILPQQSTRRPSLFNAKERTIVHSEIDKLITKGAIVPSSPEIGDFVSTIFLRPKKDGTHHTFIFCLFNLNLKQFNEFVEYHHFKIDTLKTAINMIKPGCFMASVDLKDAYYTVPIDPGHQKFVKFWFDGKYFQYTRLPNGLASAPRVFMKLLKPIYSALQSAGHLSSGYIDDSYLQGDTFEECRVNVIDSTTMFMQLGFFVHPDNSVFVPTQRLTFLGFVLDSVHMTVTPTEDKVGKILSNCNLLLQNDNPTIRQVAEVIGILVSNFPGAQYGPLHYRHLERDKYSALVAKKGDYSSAMHLSQPALTEIQWWINNATRLRRNICHGNPNVIIQSNASKLGWGAVYGKRKSGGRWTPSEAQSHINILELYAAFFALKCFCTDMHDIHVQIQIDNTTAAAYINNMGGSKSVELNQLAFSVWEWCITRNVWLSAVHIAGILNTGADGKIQGIF